MSPKLGFAGAMRRRGVTIASLAVAAVIVPVAIAFACNPQAHISLDKTSYQPGAAIGVHGSYFPAGASITINGPAGSQTVTASAGGAFQTTLQVPTAPGNYSISASRPTGGFAAASFTVNPPAQPAQTQQQQSPPSQSQSVQTQAPAATRTAPRFRTPDVARSQVTSTPDRGGSSNSEGRSNNTGAGTGGGSDSGVAVVGGTPVFAGSAPVAAPAAVASAPATVAATPVARSQRGESRASRSAAAAAPAQQAALSDLFSNYQPGRTPSLMGDASGAPAGGTGSGLGLGIALLGFGLLALVAGLTAAEARRRRPA